jgi:hypothetical protein
MRERLVDHPERRKGCQLGGLDDDRVPGGEGRRDLPDEQEQRVVERDDRGNHSERFLDREVDLMFGGWRDGRAVRVAGDLGVVLKAGRRPLDLVEILDARLASFEREQLRELSSVGASA